MPLNMYPADDTLPDLCNICYTNYHIVDDYNIITGIETWSISTMIIDTTYTI